MESNNTEDITENGQALAEDDLAREVSDHMLVLRYVKQYIREKQIFGHLNPINDTPVCKV